MSKPAFIDLFSAQSSDYARYRHGYPDEIYSWLAENAHGHEAAWDCGTGNGQAAISLAKYFNKIYATDASPQQIANATPHLGVEYKIAAAEQSGLRGKSVDVVTATSAIHWFDRPKFYAEVERVLRKGGLLAVWGVDIQRVTLEDKAIREIFQNLVGHILQDYWSSRMSVIPNNYKTMDFPFSNLPHPQWNVQLEWNRTDLEGYIRSLSATQTFIEKNGAEALRPVGENLIKYWPNPDERKQFTIPLEARIGRMP